MKSQKFTLLLLSLLAVANVAFAQLSGTYTIGGASPDYTTIQSAAADAQAQGVNGPVVFNIRPGTYAEKISIGIVSGTSATNTITFKSENNDSTSVIITDTSSVVSSNNQTFFIFSTDYLKIKNLTIERSGTQTFSSVVYVSGGCIGLEISNCVITAATTTGTAVTKALVTFPLRLPTDSLTIFSNNVYNGGSFALSIAGQGGVNPMPTILISNSVFNSQSFRAIHLTNCNAPVIRNNVLNVSTTSTTFRGIYLSDIRNNFSITLNKITGMNGGDAIYLDTCVSTAGNEGLVANNFLQSQGASNARGITTNLSAYVNFYYNSINITTTGAGSNTPFNVLGTGNTFLNIRNNIFVNSGNGVAFNLTANALTSIAVSDFNDFYVLPGATVLARYGTTDYATLADWQTGTSLDANSVSGDPQFVSAIDLHAGNAVVNNNGTPIASVTTDIDGQPRSGTTPDIGADEFSPLANNIGLVSILLPTSGSCGDSVTQLAVVIRNFGLSAQTGFDVEAEITGDITQTLSETYSASLTSNEVDTIYFSQTLNTYAGATIDVSFYTSLTGDQNTSNDTLLATYTFFGHPNTPTAISPQQTCDNNIQIVASPDSGDIAVWFDQPTGGTLLFSGNVFSPNISTDTTFYVEARTGSGSTGCLRITEIQPDDSPSDFIEIQNVSGAPLDATGWVVAANLDNSNINNVNVNLWQLGTFTAGEVQYRTDNAADNYWGSNLLWTGGNGSWAMIIDNFGNIVDFVVWDYPADSIINMNTVINGFPITIGSEWSGDGYVSCNTGGSDNQRIGSSDNNDASDWNCGLISIGVQNDNITSPFTSCGVGACGSSRIPVDVTLVPGITVSLGNDTMVGSPFSIILDPGAGFTSYLWSTGDTTQTITVSNYDTYWVTVTGGANNCSNSDSIVVSLNVGLNTTFSIDEISLFPNPAKNFLMIAGKESILQSAELRITDLQGREAMGVARIKTSSHETSFDISSLQDGVYFLQIISGNRIGIQKFVVIK